MYGTNRQNLAPTHNTILNISSNKWNEDLPPSQPWHRHSNRVTLSDSICRFGLQSSNQTDLNGQLVRMHDEWDPHPVCLCLCLFCVCVCGGGVLWGCGMCVIIE